MHTTFVDAVRACLKGARTADGYQAIGSGHELAIGALAVTGSLDPVPRIRQALKVAEDHCAAVRGPFAIVRTEVAP